MLDAWIAAAVLVPGCEITHCDSSEEGREQRFNSPQREASLDSERNPTRAIPVDETSSVERRLGETLSRVPLPLHVNNNCPAMGEH